MALLFSLLISCAGQRTGGGSYHTHVIRSEGETFSTISRRYSGTETNWRAIAAANSNLNPRKLQVGSSVRIPSYLLKTQKVKGGRDTRAGRSRSIKQQKQSKGAPQPELNSVANSKASDTGTESAEPQQREPCPANCWNEGDMPPEAEKAVGSDQSRPSSDDAEVSLAQEASAPVATPESTQEQIDQAKRDARASLEEARKTEEKVKKALEELQKSISSQSSQ